MELKDKVIFVTGAGTLGKATSLLLANKYGAKLAVADIDEDAAQQVVHEIRNNGPRHNPQTASPRLCGFDAWVDRAS